MSWQMPLLGAAVVLLLAVLVWQASPPSQALLVADWQQVSDIELTQADGVLKLQASKPSWHSEGIALRAPLQNALQQLQQLRWQRTWDNSPERLQAFGLENAHLSLSFNASTLSFGHHAPFAAEQCYARLGDTIGLVSPCPQALFGLRLSEWLSLRPLSTTEKIQSIEMDLCQAQLQSGHWSWSQQNRSQDDLQTWLQAWQYLQAYQLAPIDAWANAHTQAEAINVNISSDANDYQFDLYLWENEGLLQRHNWAYLLSPQQLHDIYPTWCRGHD